MSGAAPDEPPPPLPPPPALWPDGPPPPGAAPLPAYPAPSTRATNGFAIASMVCSLVACGIGSVLAIVFGHVARSQIKKSGDRGNGLAIAGLVIGYLGLAVIATFVLVGVLGGFDEGPSFEVTDARAFERRMVAYSRLTGAPMRDARTVKRARLAGYVDSEVLVGRTGLGIRGTSNTELDRAGWQLEFAFNGESSVGRACLTIPVTPTRRRSDVRDHRCSKPVSTP